MMLKDRKQKEKTISKNCNRVVVIAYRINEKIVVY